MCRLGPGFLLAPGVLLWLAIPLPAGDHLKSKPLQSARGTETIAVSRGGRWLVAGGKEDTRLWDLQSADPAARPLVLRGSAGVLSPDGRWLITAGNDRTIRLWDLKADDPSTAG